MADNTALMSLAICNWAAHNRHISLSVLDEKR